MMRTALLYATLRPDGGGPAFLNATTSCVHPVTPGVACPPQRLLGSRQPLEPGLDDSAGRMPCRPPMSSHDGLDSISHAVLCSFWAVPSFLGALVPGTAVTLKPLTAGGVGCVAE